MLLTQEPLLEQNVGFIKLVQFRLEVFVVLNFDVSSKRLTYLIPKLFRLLFDLLSDSD